MLEKMKSNFLLKKVFNYLYEGIKLKIIKYNKNLQNKLNLSLTNYRRFSGRYIIKENNKIKIFNSSNNQLLFIGYHINGIRVGKGKEYNERGYLLFKGEYLKGKKWKGKEKVYDQETGKLIVY